MLNSLTPFSFAGDISFTDTFSAITTNTVAGIKKYKYITPQVQVETIKVKRYSMDAGDSIYTATDLVPAGYMLQSVSLVETSGNDGVLDIGTVSGESDVLTYTVSANEKRVSWVGQYYSDTAAQTLYFKLTGSAVIDIIFVLIKFT